jgi:peptidoglycan/xylan/chitin deacetylase (PgdA/CDA1 family)
VAALGPKRWATELARTKLLLEEISGRPVQAHRSPSWSVRTGSLWALSAVAASGFRYDASLYPAGTPLLGTAAAPRQPHRILLPDGSELREFPASVWGWPWGLPVGGGFFLRVVPAGWIRRSLEAHARAGRPAIVYVHPWEVDHQPPRVRLPLPWRAVQYHGLARTAPRLEELLARYPFASLSDVAAQLDWSRVPVWRLTA